MIALLLAAATCATAVAQQADECYFDPDRQILVCHASGLIPGEPAPEPVDPGVPPPLRYVHTATDPVIGECHFWSSVPGGLDAWDPGNDPAVLATVSTLPLCPGSPVPPVVEDRAWEVFRSFPMTPPAPTLEPPDNGITGLATYLAAPSPGPFTYSELLPDGRTLSVRAVVVTVTVDWGDGGVATHDPSAARPYPEGSVTNVYRLKTCPADYRRQQQRGSVCHPTLEAYEITATFTWVGEWTVGGAWQTLGTLDLTDSVSYDVDEVIGVLQP
jgi:hypothetical protein